MLSKHTPGRWAAFKERHFWVVKDEQGQRLASLLESESVFTDGVEHDDARANAELMACAPKLLAALEAMVGAAKVDSSAYLRSCMRDAELVIAQAKGKKP